MLLAGTRATVRSPQRGDCQMPVIYVNLLNGRERFVHRDGFVVKHDEFEVEDVLQAVEELRNEQPSAVLEEWNGWALEIVDTRCQVVHVVAL